MSEDLLLIIVGVGSFVLVTGGSLLLVWKLYVSVPSGKALLVRNSRGDVRIERRGVLALPGVIATEMVDLGATRVDVGGSARGGFRCLNRVRVTLTARFVLSVVPTEEGITSAARQLGAARVADPSALGEVFGGKLEEAVASVIGRIRYEDLLVRRAEVRDEIVREVNQELEGFDVQDVSLIDLQQVPLEKLDPDDILDAEAIRYITDVTAEENRKTAEIRSATRMAIANQDLVAAEHEARIEAQQQRSLDAHEAEMERRRRDG